PPLFSAPGRTPPPHRIHDSRGVRGVLESITIDAIHFEDSLQQVVLMRRLIMAAGVLAVALQLPIGAQGPAAASSEIDVLKRLTFRNIGPTNQAGRVSVIVGIPGDPFTFY